MQVDTDPDRIVCVHSEQAKRQTLVDACTRVTGVDVVGVESGAAGLDKLETDDVCCLVFGADVGEMAPRTLAAKATDHGPDRPLLFAPFTPDADQLMEVLSAGANDVLDPTGEESTDRVANAIETYRRRRQLAKDSDLLDGLFSSLPVALYAKDEQARTLRMTDVPGGTDPEYARGKTDLELYGEELAAASYEDDIRVIENGEEIHEKIELTTDGENNHWSKTTKVPWEKDGAVRGLFGITQDITEYKETERRLRRRINRLDQFTNYVAHDVRTPLELASSHLELARSSVANGEVDAAQTSMEKVGSALKQIEDLIDDFQELTNEESIGPLSRPTNQIQFKELLWNIWEQTDTGRASLEVAVPDETTIRASRSQLRPLVRNLIKNAVDHAGPDVSITVGVLNDGFFIEDDGSGIPEKDREAVLEAGYTSDSDGSGLGLSIVTDIVEAHDWDLTIAESEAGGARFEFTNCLIVTDKTASTPSAETIELTENQDIGDVIEAGTASYDPTQEVWTVQAAGDDIWRNTNAFHYVYTDVTGDVRIEGTVSYIEAVHDYSKAGLMIRGSLDPDAAYGYVGRTHGQGAEVLWRSEAGQPGVSQHPNTEETITDRFRIDRVDDRITCWVQDEAENWMPIDQRPVSVDETVQVGLATTSVVPRRLCETNFSDVAIHPLE